MRSQSQINNIKNGVLKSKLKRMDNYEYIGSFVPYGYIKKEKKLVPDKETSHIVYLIFDLYDKGCSNTQIANYLNDRSIVSPSAYKLENEYIDISPKDNNKLWTRGSIRKIIQNKVYNGYYQYVTNGVKTHEPIINDELFNRVQDMIKNKKNTAGNDFYYHNGNIFCNKAICSCCGKPFTLENSKTKDGIIRYLRCGSYDSRRKNKVECQNKLSIRYDELKEIVNMFVEDNIFSTIDLKELQDVYFNYLKNDNIDIHRKYLKQERALLKSKIANVNTDIKVIDVISKLKLEKNIKLLSIYNKRLSEVENILKNIYSFARTKEITNNEFYTDKFIIDNFIDKISIGIVENKNRNIEVFLK